MDAPLSSRPGKMLGEGQRDDEAEITLGLFKESSVLTGSIKEDEEIEVSVEIDKDDVDVEPSLDSINVLIDVRHQFWSPEKPVSRCVVIG
ncbi:unnamed protein product [Ambrosiozyma monospora]|uniref:Unnamed protein product n=1 Tax=Ambrosiozyma monospora TaxID=43982 RepID=A0ACB5STQ0_AMBMO|nr:unnamed protein product [Ambrosiozyma monospora]